MLEEIWEHDAFALFVGLAAIEPSPTLGFHLLHPKDRFWELLELASITSTRIITKEERKAMAEGHARGNITDPVRQIFLLKKTSQLLRQGIGITYLNPNAGTETEKDKGARPSVTDIQTFLDGCASKPARLLGFLCDGALFADLFGNRFPPATGLLGKQGWMIGSSEVWFLGSPQASLKGEALLAQEDLFYAFGERLAAIREEAASR